MSSIRGLFQLDVAPNPANLGFTAVRHADSGCAIAADASLYYRDELLASLGLTNSTVNDSELILSAYLRWGEDCVGHLQGDFAFAIQDPREEKLFCARDRYGMRPFYYHHSPGRFIAFASDARNVVRYEQVPFAINEGRIADFIVPQLEWIDCSSTFYEGVYRLPPAHALTVAKSGMTIAEFWSPMPGPELICKTDAEFREGFLEVFTRAVRERLHVSDKQVGSMLSGGMDSGSVTAVALNLQTEGGIRSLPIYSLSRRRGVECLESERIYATLDHLGVAGSQIIADEADSLVGHVGATLAEPFDGDFLFLRAIYENARRDGIGVMLDGGAGDLVLNAGAYIARLIRHGRVAQAWRETVGEEAFWGSRNPGRGMVRYLASSLAPNFVKRRLREPRQRRREQQYVSSSLINSEFAERINIEARFERMREMFSEIQSDDPCLERVRKIRPHLTAGRERFGRIAASAGIEVRDPFTDQRVVDFCSRLPDEQIARDGWPKYLLRDAMRGLLPDAVRWGLGKPHIAHLYNNTFLEREIDRRKLSPDILATALAPYIDARALRSAWRAFQNGDDPGPIHSAVVLSLWLEQTAKRPVVNDQGFG